MADYSKRELKRMLKPGASIPVDAPSFIHRKVDQRRIEFNRNSKSPAEIIDGMFEEDARRWMPVKRPNWINRFRKILGRSSRFANKLRGLIIK